jgi:hypothetical protein
MSPRETGCKAFSTADARRYSWGLRGRFFQSVVRVGEGQMIARISACIGVHRRLKMLSVANISLAAGLGNAASRFRRLGFLLALCPATPYMNTRSRIDAG